MVILVGGESHTGKTLMAQKLLEKYHFPYTSIDHIKMGLILGDKNCDFTALDHDEAISEKLWGVIKGIVQTCVENKQNIILEGCYLPPDKMNEVLGKEVICLYLIFSENYIKNHFSDIMQYEHTIEKRKYQEERTSEEFIRENQRLKAKCVAHDLSFFEIDDDYQKDIAEAYRYIDDFLLNIRPYTENDLDALVQLFYDTVHSVNAKDYSARQRNAWATGKIDKIMWHQSLAAHYSIVAEKNGEIVGFGDLDGGYLDRLYVHKDYQRQGIATAIIEKLEQYAIAGGETEITTHASITAKEFFLRRGYELIKEQQVQRNGILLINFVMKKYLSESS